MAKQIHANVLNSRFTNAYVPKPFVQILFIIDRGLKTYLVGHCATSNSVSNNGAKIKTLYYTQTISEEWKKRDKQDVYTFA